jgi:CDP-diacylglycerol--inositol 3-phosphatidyltransferase
LQVAAFVPNLIGYSRFMLLLACPYVSHSDTLWPLFIVFYGLSQLLDAVDGNAARYFN